MPLSDFLDVSTLIGSIATSRPGYGIPMLLGTHTNFGAVAKSYGKPAEMLDDGFLVTDPLYIGASRLYDQAQTPPRFWIGKRSTPVAQVDTVTVDVNTDGDYTSTLNGTEFTYSAVAKTKTEIRDALVAAINGGSEPVTAAPVSTDQYTVTADEAGIGFTHTVTANMSKVATTPNNGIVEDLTLIAAYTKDWYAWASDDRSATDIKVASVWSQSNKKLYIAQNNDADLIDPALSTDIASQLKTLGHSYTAVVYHASDAEWADAMWLGTRLPKDPGQATWHKVKGVGCTPNTLTSAQTAALVAKNANWFEEVGGHNVMLNGITAGGIYIDLRRGVDWLTTNIEYDVNDLQVNEDKVPFTEEGAAQVATVVEARLLDSARRGLVVKSSIVVETLAIASAPTNEKAARQYDYVTWSATAQGAMHKIKVTGTVSA